MNQDRKVKRWKAANDKIRMIIGEKIKECSKRFCKATGIRTQGKQ